MMALTNKGQDQRKSSSVAELLTYIERDATTRPSKTKILPRNFARENILKLREIQRLSRLARENTANSSTARGLSSSSSKKYRDIPSRLSTYHTEPVKATCRPSSLECKKTKETLPFLIATAETNNNEVGRIQRSGSRPQHYDSRGRRAVSVDRACSKHVSKVKPTPPSGAARPATVKPASNVSKTENTRMPDIPKLTLKEMPAADDEPKQSKTTLTPPKKPVLRRSLSFSNTTDRNKHNLELPTKYQLGSVPKYLQERQRQWREEEERRRLEEPDPNLPPGHVLLPENERLETFQQIQDSYNDVLRRMAMLPLRNDTLRIRQQKEEHEKQLIKLEEAMKIFSQPKVYINKNA